MDSTIRIIKLINKDILSEIYTFRVKIWKEILGELPISKWEDSTDLNACHFAAILKGKVVAAARLSIHESLEEIPDQEVFDGVLRQVPPRPFGVLGVPPVIVQKHTIRPIFVQTP